MGDRPNHALRGEDRSPLSDESRRRSAEEIGSGIAGAPGGRAGTGPSHLVSTTRTGTGTAAGEGPVALLDCGCQGSSHLSGGHRGEGGRPSSGRGPSGGHRGGRQAVERVRSSWWARSRTAGRRAGEDLPVGILMWRHDEALACRDSPALEAGVVDAATICRSGRARHDGADRIIADRGAAASECMPEQE